VINVSDGTSRCAHDGRSIVEQAMQALVADLQAQQPPIDLDLVLAAGNNFAEMRHATLGVADPERPSAQVTLRLAPGNEAASFVTVAVPSGTRDLQLALVPPGFATMAEPWVDIGSDDAGTLRCWPDEAHAVAWVASLRPAAGESRIVALSWAPTASVDASDGSAPVGDWVIAVRRKPGSPDPGSVSVDAWISRGQTNAGGVERSRQLVFVDTDDAYDPCRASRSCEDDPQPPRSPIRRQGTLKWAGHAGRPGRRDGGRQPHPARKPAQPPFVHGAASCPPAGPRPVGADRPLAHAARRSHHGCFQRQRGACGRRELRGTAGGA
jgi:hypothetical protein